MSIEILTGFDGSCPHFKHGVKQDRQRRFTLYPGYRKRKGISEEAPGRGSRFSTRIMNHAGRPRKATITVDWTTDDRTKNHDIGFVRHDDEPEWRMIAGIRSGAGVKYRLTLRPGLTYLGLYPQYNYTQCAEFVGSLAQKGADVRVIGKSREKRDMWLIRFTSPNRKARNFFFQARDHAYETAGSYGVEGVVDFLLSDDPVAHYIRSKFSVHIVPMTNPDGVYNGMSRLTWEKGADMNRVHTVPDAAHDTLIKAIDAVRPFVHMNVHNWTGRHNDGLLCNDENIAERIQQHMPDDHQHYKRWQVQTHLDYLRGIGKHVCPDEDKSWKNYCKERFDAYGCNFELPWFAMNTAGMREKGKKAFIAFALAVVEEARL